MAEEQNCSTYLVPFIPARFHLIVFCWLPPPREVYIYIPALFVSTEHYTFKCSMIYDACGPAISSLPRLHIFMCTGAHAHTDRHIYYRPHTPAALIHSVCSRHHSRRRILRTNNIAFTSISINVDVSPNDISISILCRV